MTKYMMKKEVKSLVENKETLRKFLDEKAKLSEEFIHKNSFNQTAYLRRYVFGSSAEITVLSRLLLLTNHYIVAIFKSEDNSYNLLVENGHEISMAHYTFNEIYSYLEGYYDRNYCGFQLAAQD